MRYLGHCMLNMSSMTQQPSVHVLLLSETWMSCALQSTEVLNCPAISKAHSKKMMAVAVGWEQLAVHFSSDKPLSARGAVQVIFGANLSLSTLI